MSLSNVLFFVSGSVWIDYNTHSKCMGRSLWLPSGLSEISDLLHVHTCRPVCQLLHAGENFYKFSQLFKRGSDDIYLLPKKKKEQKKRFLFFDLFFRKYKLEDNATKKKTSG